jgi:hypothetical protein
MLSPPWLAPACRRQEASLAVFIGLLVYQFTGLVVYLFIGNRMKP